MIRFPSFPRFFSAAAAIMLACGSPLSAQTPPDPLDITGRTFTGLKLPLAPTTGPIEFVASKGTRWIEADGGEQVQRLLLTGDVKARLGGYEVIGSRAVVWLAPTADAGTWQIWMYVEQGGSSVPGKGIQVSGDRLPVQGIIRTPEGIKLKLAAPAAEGRPQDPFVAEAERALAQRLRAMVQPAVPTGPSPEDLVRQGQPVPPISGPEPAAPEPEIRRILETEARLAPAPGGGPIFAQGGIFSIIASGIVPIVKVQDTGENAVIVEGGVVVSYWDRRRDRTIQLSAQRAVIFLREGELEKDFSRLDRDSVRGLYLEGDVVADLHSAEGHFNMRAPRVYYSVQNDRAVLVDAVFWTHDAKLGLPLYVRAKSIEQTSATEFKATSARLTNSAFFEPGLSIGASSVTIRPTQEENGERRVIVDARDVTFRAGRVPFFYWPRLRGEPGDIALRDLRLDSSTGSGAALKTTWNFHSLVGIESPRNARADLMLDWYFDRGAAVGTELSWGDDQAGGGLLGYIVPTDYGRDTLPTGQKRDFDGITRAILTAEHRARLSEAWTLFLEGAYISDETFTTAYFRDDAINRREYMTSAYLRRLEDNTALTIQAQTNLNDFIANEYLLQSPGYTVSKYPEIGYTRLADDVIPEHPGLLSYSSQWRLTQMRMEFPDVTPESLGYRNASQSALLFGVAPGQSISEGLRARGFTEEAVTRFDTRHELTMPLSAGPVNITPFTVGRITAYDDDFSTYSAEADDPYRLWAGGGVRVGTEIQRVDNSVESRLFDLHRIRHIVRPSVTLWTAGSTIDRVDLPVYDDEVESLAEGTAARFAIDQTWQTQRGGPGRWRSVDVFKLNGEVVASSGDVDRKSPIGRYFDFAPELSSLGDTYGAVDALWQVSEVVGLGAGTVYDFRIDQPARTDIGITLQHTPDFQSYLDLRYLNAEDSTTFIFGGSYDLTKKYSVAGNAAYDTNLGQLQSIAGEIRRRYPNIILGLGLSYNNITGETSFGVVLQPVGLSKSGGARLRGLGTGTAAGVGG